MGMKANALGRIASIEKRTTKKGGSWYKIELDISGSKQEAFLVQIACFDKNLHPNLRDIREGQVVVCDAVAEPSEYNGKIYTSWKLTSIFAYGSNNKSRQQEATPPKRETAPAITDDEDDVPF